MEIFVGKNTLFINVPITIESHLGLFSKVDSMLTSPIF